MFLNKIVPRIMTKFLFLKLKEKKRVSAQQTVSERIFAPKKLDCYLMKRRKHELI